MQTAYIARIAGSFFYQFANSSFITIFANKYFRTIC